MKRYLNFLITCIVAAAAVSSCNFYALDEVWDPELENVFYCGYDEWIAQRTDGTNQLKYTISNGESATMPFRLWSEFTRDFDVNVPIYFYPDEIYQQDPCTGWTQSDTGLYYRHFQCDDRLIGDHDAFKPAFV